MSINPQNRNQLLQLVEDNNDQIGSSGYSRSRRSRNSDHKPSYNQGPITSLGFPQTTKRSPSSPFYQSAPQPLFLPNSALSNLLLQTPNHVAPDQLLFQVPDHLAPFFNSPLRTTDPGNEGIPHITPQNIPLEFAIPPHNPGWQQVTKHFPLTSVSYSTVLRKTTTCHSGRCRWAPFLCQGQQGPTWTSSDKSTWTGTGFRPDLDDKSSPSRWIKTNNRQQGRFRI